jgi:Zn-dependent peptidase ImmA (M78 family)
MLASTNYIEREARTFAVELLLPDDFSLEYPDYSLESLEKMVGIPANLRLLKRVR